MADPTEGTDTPAPEAPRTDPADTDPAVADESATGQDEAGQAETADGADDKPSDADHTEATPDDTTKTFSIDTDPPAADGVKDYVKPTGPTPGWWDWVRKHPKPVLVVTGLLVVGLVATLVIVAVVTPGPKDVVQKYMDAIRAGDTEAALAIAGQPKEQEVSRLKFLSEKALADDWTVDSIVERQHDEDDAEVDVTIRAGKSSQQGRFSLVHGDDGWRIESPFVKISLVAGQLDVVELGDERQNMFTGQQNGVAELLLFPGVYELYPSLSKRATYDPKVLIAAPQAFEEAVVQVSATRTLTDTSKDDIAKKVNAYIDECAKKSSLSPSNCPFDAENNSALWQYDYIDDVTWTVLTYPEAYLGTGNRNELLLGVRKPGTIRLTGMGTPDEPEDAAPVSFTVTCEFGFSGIDVTMTMDGFEVGSDGRGYPLTDQETRCFV